MEPITKSAVANLIVIGNTDNETVRCNINSLGATWNPILLKLPCEQPAFPDGRQQLFRRSGKVSQVSFVLACHQRADDMMKIVCPYRITTVTALRARQNNAPLVARVFADDEPATPLNLLCDFLNYMRFRIVGNSVSGIETKCIEVNSSRQ